MGAVYEAHDRSRDRLVAVKTLQTFDPYQLYCLKNEFRALADVLHPNLVALFELVQEDADWWLVMERVHGRSVDKWVCPEQPDSGALQSGASVSRVRESFAQIAQGLRALHRAGKLHRDLKPSNVLVEEGGRAVLLDFGLVVDRAAASEPPLTRRAGTAEYLSPERMRGEAAQEASDWYALGVMLYEALTGLLPRGPRKLSGPLRVPQTVDPSVPEDLSALCLELLAEDPAQRPSGREIVRRLRGKSSSGSPAPDALQLLLGRDAELVALEQASAGRWAWCRWKASRASARPRCWRRSARSSAGARTYCAAAAWWRRPAPTKASTV
jgi:serine/threonine protein kinase